MSNLSFSSIILLILLIPASYFSTLLHFSSTFLSRLLPKYFISLILLLQRPAPFYNAFRSTSDNTYEMKRYATLGPQRTEHNNPVLHSS